MSLTQLFCLRKAAGQAIEMGVDKRLRTYLGHILSFARMQANKFGPISLVPVHLLAAERRQGVARGVSPWGKAASYSY